MPELVGDERFAEAAPSVQPQAEADNHGADDHADDHTADASSAPLTQSSDMSAEAAADAPYSVWGSAFRAALAAWVVAHIVIIAVQDLAQRVTPKYSAQMPNGPQIFHMFNQLYTWDTAWYAGIAQYGYHGVASDGVRFWPLMPLTTRAVAATGIGALTAVLVVAWAGALLFGMLMYRLALAVGGDAVTARRAAWLSQLAPGAFVLVMGYTEALAGVFAAAYLIAIRQSARRAKGSNPADQGSMNQGSNRQVWLWHAAGFLAGLGSGLVRPTGLLLAAAGGIEVLRQWRDPKRHLAARVLVAISPPMGTGIYLLWSHHVYGNYTLPYTIQKLEGLRGTYAGNPLTSALDSVNQVGNGAGAFTLVLVVTSIGLLGASVRRLPVSYTVWAAISLLAAITAPHFSSFARYSAGILPLLLVAALMTRDWRRWAWVVGLCTALCAYFAYQSFIGIYIP
ncbi:MAG TPA: hypothetical protein VGS97_24085 [Actinocrinis sp.]|uniref:hypothetical protein n=1 Tax=Actinocrinis sp. TaxID=1920516 RepID=UPI002DDCE88E|nr:hypothetical protein [Actinocrinis sp.]HEV2347198.1 hypothetical protein [Actinocrinis sp.]